MAPGVRNVDSDVRDGATRVYDRRGRRRSPFFEEVNLRLGALVIDGVAYDLSTGGMGLHVDEELEPGTEVSVEFDLGGEELVSIDARVAWCSAGKAGLRFTRLGPMALARLMDRLAA